MKILEAKLTVINKEMYIYFFFLCCYEIYAHSHFDLKLFHAKFKVKNFLQREFQKKKKLGVKEISILLWRSQLFDFAAILSTVIAFSRRNLTVNHYSKIETLG